jgi:glutamate 5-kinase
MVAQVLLTRDGLDDEQRCNNAVITLNELLLMKVIPIINENDTVSTAEIQFGDNDNLSAKVSIMLKAGILILLTDMDGLYTSDPENHPEAERIRVVEEINQELESVIYQSSSAFGKGGMSSKLNAAGLCMNNHIDVAIINGNNPKNLYRLMAGEDIGTLFISPKVNK